MVDDGNVMTPEKENKKLQRILRDAEKVIGEMQAALTAIKPKAEAFDDLMDSDGTCTLGRAAKIIGWPGGVGEFYRYLIEKSDIYPKMNFDLYPHKREYFPMETARRKGYFKVDVSTIKCGDKNVVAHTTKVTAPGLDHLRRLIRKDFDLEEDEG
jgi:phage antirepressor YoqD-like protein